MASRTRKPATSTKASPNGSRSHRELDDMAAALASQTKQFKVSVETIDSAKAQEFLGSNWDNRKVRPRRVTSYATYMLKGQWLATGDPIQFREDEHLLNGQHRLLAIIQAASVGVPPDLPPDPTISIDCIVIRDLPAEAFTVIDSGLARGPGEALGNDVKNVNVKASAIRLIITLERGQDPRRSHPLSLVTRVDIADYYADHTGEVDAAVHIAMPFIGKSGFANANYSAWIAFILLGWSVNRSATNEFVDAVLSGAGLSSGDPRLVLRNFMSRTSYTKTLRAEHLGIYIKAWNAWMNGETRTLLPLKDNEAFPTMVKRRAAIYTRD